MVIKVSILGPSGISKSGQSRSPFDFASRRNMCVCVCVCIEPLRLRSDGKQMMDLDERTKSSASLKSKHERDGCLGGKLGEV